MVYGACVVMVAPRIRFSTEILVYTLYTTIYVVCGPEIYAFCTNLAKYLKAGTKSEFLKTDHPVVSYVEGGGRDGVDVVGEGVLKGR